MNRQPEAALSAATIVVVGSDPPDERPISCILREAGLQVQDVATGAEALALLPAEPDLVVVTANVPDVDSADLIRRLKGRSTPPMVVRHVVASSTVEGEQRARDDGADGYLTEPLVPLQVLATVRSLLNLRRFILELHRSEERFDLLVDQAPLLIVAVNEAGDIVLFNRACQELTGHTRAEVLGRPLLDLVLPEAWRPIVRERLQDASALVLATPHENPWLTRWGGEHAIEWRSFRIPGPDGSARIVSFGDDVTERKQAAQRQATTIAVRLILAEAATPEIALPRLLEAIGEALDWEVGEAWRVRPEGDELRWAGTWHARGREAWAFEVASRDMGFKKGEGLPGRVWATGAPEWTTDVRNLRGFFRARMATMAGLRSAFAFPLGTGAEIEGAAVFFSRAFREPDEALAKMIFDVGDRIGQFIARRRVESALRESETRARRLFEQSLAGIFRAGRDGRLLECNDAFARLLGYPSRSVVRALRPAEFCVDDAEWERLLQRLDGEQVVRDAVMRFRHVSGHALLVWVNAARVGGLDSVCYEGVISGLDPLAASP